MKKSHAKIAASTVALSMSLSALFGATAAFAQDKNQLGEMPDIDRDTINSLIHTSKTTAKFTIQKFKTDEPGTKKGDGTKATGVDGEGMEAEFKVYKINNLNPKEFESWKKYTKLDASKFNAEEKKLDGYTLSDPVTMKTDKTTGEASQEFDLGFYYVEEVPKAGYTKVSPFTVALPMTNPDDSSWNYDVHVAPKNQKFGVVKTVKDAYKNAGDTIEYNITGDTIRLPQGKDSIERYAIVDHQPTNITVDPESAQVKIVYKADKADKELKLEKVDFTSTKKPNNATDTIIKLTDAGLKKMTNIVKDAKNTGIKVSVDLQAKINGTPETPFPENTEKGGVITETNTAYLYVDNGFGDPENPDPNDPNDKVTSKYGSLKLLKKGEDTNKPLANAVFQLYRCAPTEEGTPEAENPKTIEGPLTVNGKDSWETDTEGKITITGLQVDDFRNGGNNDIQADSTKDLFDYCVVETKAPQGYELLPNPVPLDLGAENAIATAEITNVPDNGGIDLPFTGEKGAMMLYITAGLIASAGVVYLMASSRRKQ